jgi:hypothetical protein
MTTKAALFALLAVWGVGTACPVVPAFAEDNDAAIEEADSGSPLKRSFTNRVWTKADSDLPGIVRIFLSDGTLVSDSCWETHRLSPWKWTSDSAISWNEDGMDINADIVSVSATDLVLKLDLAGGAVEERYVAADVPYVCPDMPKA